MRLHLRFQPIQRLGKVLTLRAAFRGSHGDSRRNVFYKDAGLSLVTVLPARPAAFDMLYLEFLFLFIAHAIQSTLNAPRYLIVKIPSQS